MIALAIVPGVVDGQGAASLAATAPLAEAVARLAASPGEALAVVADDGRLMGLIGAAEVVARLAVAGAAALALPAAAAARPADDWLMPDDAALDALELMRLRGVEHLAVLEADGRLAGIVSHGRLCRLLHRAYDALTDAEHRALFGVEPGP
jgi:CBS domain-containing protein